jgi:hypothetical protein
MSDLSSGALGIQLEFEICAAPLKHLTNIYCKSAEEYNKSFQQLNFMEPRFMPVSKGKITL